MRSLSSLALLCFLQLSISCNNKKEVSTENVLTEQVTLTETVEEIEPSPPQFRSSFKTLYDWLKHICSTETPIQAITNYEFGMFESPGEYVVYLVGKNKHQISSNNTETRIEYQPATMYCSLPEKEYGDLSPEQVRERLFTKLQTFTKQMHSSVPSWPKQILSPPALKA